ncbi:hypothetical protein DPEC_G00138400 [Dallia pectoralis]|uniref:Uncharacterized protein n=1 Tax=Dallia pectoralis TaxID=75939 RepID=A0ACC2GLZ5_DALPE|nr:hypothetical protein DPEC_G00138400 [Dallia pectoralis]
MGDSDSVLRGTFQNTVSGYISAERDSVLRDVSNYIFTAFAPRLHDGARRSYPERVFTCSFLPRRERLGPYARMWSGTPCRSKLDTQRLRLSQGPVVYFAFSCVLQTTLWLPSLFLCYFN